FVTCLGYATLYDIPDFRVYFLQAHAATGVWAAFGAAAVLDAAKGPWRGPARGACAAAVALPLALNFPLADKSRDHAVEDFARNVMASMDSGAVLLTNEYWVINSPVDYLQQVEGSRRDVTVIDVGLLGHDWFYDQLETRTPRLAARSRAAIDALRAEIRSTLNGKPNPAAYNARLSALFRDLAAKSLTHGPVYATAGIDPSLLPGYRFMPSGL